MSVTPPPVRLGSTVAAPVDVDRVRATVTFDIAARRAEVEATVDFAMDEDGCPALDLRQPLGSVVVDGDPLPPDACAHRDLGGGPGAEMRVVDRAFVAGTRHRLEVGYALATPDATGAQPVSWGDGVVAFDLWMSDLYPGRYLEMWLPANLCHDRFGLTVDVVVTGASVDHAVLSNGAGRALGGGRTRISYPSHFTSLSPMLVVAPAPDIEIRRRTVALQGRGTPIQLVTARHAEADADAAACEEDVAGWLAHHSVRYGPWAHGDSFVAVIWGAGRGMEYDGSTTASDAALEHEVFHSWFGRGIKPARSSDGWIDEAWTSWATSSRRVEGPRFPDDELGLDEPPVVLYPPHPWSRYTPTESYREGARFFGGLAHRLGGASRLRRAMADWYRANVGRPVTTDGLERHLEEWSGLDLAPWFRRYVHGEDGSGSNHTETA
jgi:hypothetical protein